MPNWKKVITSGSDASLNTLSVDNNTHLSGSLNVFKSGSTVFTVEGSQGTLFQITDQLSGSLFAVADISGVPSFEVFSDDTVKIGTFGSEAVVVEGDVLKLSQLSNQSSEATAVVINGSNVVGTRELGSNAFTSTTIPTNNNQLTNGAGYITDGNTNWNNSYGFITATSTDTLTNKSGNISMFTNDAGYITDGNTGWNNSYGFITGVDWDEIGGTQSDINISGFNNDSGFTSNTGTVTSVATGTGLTGGTITSTGTISLSHLGFQNLTDPNDDRIAFWDDSAGAFAWLDIGSGLSISGTTISNTITNNNQLTNGAGYITDGNTNWNNSYGFITGLDWEELGGAQSAINISGFNNDAGYITDGNTNWNNSYGFITATSTDTLTNKSGNISQWTNDSGYITDGNTGWNNTYGFITGLNWSELGGSQSDINISGFTNDAGYITDGNTNWNNSYGFITATSTDTLTNKSGNISMFTNDAGYITDGNTNWNNSYGFITGVNWDEIGGTQSDINLSGFNNDLTLSSFTNDAGFVAGDTFDNAGTYANLRAQATTKADVGLGNVTNESKATMFTNAALTGNPTAPTQTSTNDSTRIATTAFVQNRIDEIIGNAGSTLDTLGELSASLANDQDSLAALTTTVGTKLAKASNLSDLTDEVAARSNLGLGTAATTNSTAYATAAQGAKADTALQSLGSVTGHTDVTSAGSGAIITSAERTKLSGIASGAEVNVQSDWNATSGDALILNKPTIPTNNNQLTNGAGYITSFTNTMGSGFKIIDGDTTQVSITENNYIKFVEGESIDINFTDTSNGSSSDPYDLTFSLKTAGAGAGTYGSTADGTKIDTITIDAYGRVTAVATGATGTSTTSGTVTSVATGTGLTGGTITSTGTLSLSHLGLESLTDPDDDRIFFWDDSAGASAWLDIGSGLSISGTTISNTITNNNQLTNGAGYITDGNTNWNNTYGFITATSTDTLTNKSGNISQWTNDVGYTTNIGDITGVTAGDGLTGGGGSGAVTIDIDYTGTDNAILAAVDASGNAIDTGAKIWYSDDGTIAHANVSDLPFSNNSGTVTSVGITAGTGLSGGGTITTSGTISLAVDLSELTDMTATMVGTDEFIVLDAGADRRKAASEIGLSIFNNDAGYITDGNTNWNNTYGFITATSVDTLTNKSGNISQWTNDSGYITDGNTNWNNTYGFITATSTDTLTNKSGNISMFTNDAGYITDGNTNWNNSYGFITATSTDTLTNKSGNISQWTNDAGYITSYVNTNQLTTFQVEDGDGTEVTISHGKEWKFVEAGGININWTDTSNGSDADPYDLSFSINTGITATNGLTGGGTLSSNRTVEVDYTNAATNVIAAAPGANIPGATGKIIFLDDAGVNQTPFSTIPTSILNNDAGFTSNVGDITDVRLTGDSGYAQDSSGVADLTVAGGNAISTVGSGTTLTINHDDTSTQASVNNSNNTVIQDVTLDTYGHVTGLASKTISLSSLGYTGATNADNYTSWQFTADGLPYNVTALAGVTLNAGANVTITHDGAGNVDITAADTNTTYSAGTGLTLSSTTFSIQSDLRDSITYIGYDSNDYIQWSNNAWTRIVVNGSERLRATTSGVDVTGTLTATADIIAYYSSDERLKDNIVNISNPIDKIKKIGGYEFDWNEKQSTYEGHDVGVIAQEVEEVLPELVTTRDDGYKAVKYEKMVALLIEGMKEQQSQIEELKSEISKLKGEG